MTGCIRGLVLKLRQRTTRKWPIRALRSNGSKQYQCQFATLEREAVWGESHRNKRLRYAICDSPQDCEMRLAPGLRYATRPRLFLVFRVANEEKRAQHNGHYWIFNE